MVIWRLYNCYCLIRFTTVFISLTSFMRTYFRFPHTFTIDNVSIRTLSQQPIVSVVLLFFFRGTSAPCRTCRPCRVHFSYAVNSARGSTRTERQRFRSVISFVLSYLFFHNDVFSADRQPTTRTRPLRGTRLRDFAMTTLWR